MRLTDQFKPIPVQAAALDFVKASPARFNLLYGGGGSGKSVVISYILAMRGMNAPGSRHGIFRKTATSCRKTLFDLAFREALEMTYPGLLADKHTKINETEMSIELPNGSIFFFAGLDSSNITRIMGDKFATIWMNECDEFTYDDVMKLKSRLRDVKQTISGKQLPLKMFFDLNPDAKDHFTYRVWVDKINPDRNLPLRKPEDYDSFQMNVSATDTHLGADYLQDQLEGSDAHIQRYVHGYWRDEREHSMFKPSTVNANRVQEAPDLKRIVVAIDPAASSHEKSDETGIIVAGQCFDGHYYILDDFSLKAQPEGWAEAASDAYRKWSADAVIAERNNGGDMVTSTLRLVAPHLPVKTVWASRGKIVRAEPISALYASNKVHHVGEFSDLEQQMYRFHTDFSRSKDGSPDRLDALVWALSELSGEVEKPNIGRGGKVRGFW
ncbi:MAG: phage terminase large subunit [Sphingobium sp.]